MLQSRRGFLMGAGSLLTTAFVRDACVFLCNTGQPLLAAPAQVSETLYWYDSAEDGYMLSLGEWSFDPPPPPTWRQFFTSHGIAHTSERDVLEIYQAYFVDPQDYDNPVDDDYWCSRWECEDSGCAKAYRLLSTIDIGPQLRSGRGPLLEFHVGAHPSDSSHWVDAKDKLSLSLLQARLIDLKLPIKLAPAS